MTGKTLAKTQAGLAHRFIEGIVQRTPGGNWFASTYQDNVVVEYNADLTHVVGEHAFPLTGWGFTRTPDSSAFLTTNGSSYVMRIDPVSFRMQSSIQARCLDYPVPGLNELEMVDDFMGSGPTLLGNVYESRIVLALNPTTMQCTGVLSLEGLGTTTVQEQWGFNVANGVAYNKHNGHLVITGKNWPKMYDVALSRDSSEQALDLLRRHLSTRPLVIP
jgi:glutamine cyclotransferase